MIPNLARELWFPTSSLFINNLGVLGLTLSTREAKGCTCSDVPGTVSFGCNYLDFREKKTIFHNLFHYFSQIDKFIFLNLIFPILIFLWWLIQYQEMSTKSWKNDRSAAKNSSPITMSKSHLGKSCTTCSWNRFGRPSPKKTISGLTRPWHNLHWGMTSLNTCTRQILTGRIGMKLSRDYNEITCAVRCQFLLWIEIIIFLEIFLRIFLDKFRWKFLSCWT